MGHFLGIGWLILLITAKSMGGEDIPSINVKSLCLGNVLRLSIGPLGENLLEVGVGNNDSVNPLTPRLGSQCGFSVKMDPTGNAVLFASILNCFVQTTDNKNFASVIHFRVHGSDLKDELHMVTETCSYPSWAYHEIICDRNYMEVSVRMKTTDKIVPREPMSGESSQFGPWTSALRSAIVVFFTPEQRAMRVDQVLREGYGIASTAMRLVLRSPHQTHETYAQNVAGIPMTVLKTSTILESMGLRTQVDAVATCPTSMDGVSFTSNMITWFLPLHIDPLISSNNYQLLEVHMGIAGQRLDSAEMAARQYMMSFSDAHIIIEIPVGAVGGLFKSHVQKGQYFTTYTIEPMLELLWNEGEVTEDTKYKVMFPITTPLINWNPQVIDDTVPEEMIFKLLLRPLASDVQLLNVTFPKEVLTVAECNARGFNIQEKVLLNGSKTFSIEVSFLDPVVVKTRGESTTYSLNLIFGLMVLPEQSAFVHQAVVHATLMDTVLTSIIGNCDPENFYVTVKYGNQGVNFQTVIGKRLITQELAQQYGLIDNGTHFRFAVPYLSPDVVFEGVEKSSIRCRLDVTLKDPVTSTNIKMFSVACNFLSLLTECFSNGTMTALAMKLESVPDLNVSQLTLNDPACGPSLSDNRFAYFVFTASSCGTTRKFLADVMLYENYLSLPVEPKVTTNFNTDEPEYVLKISCFYKTNTTESVAFSIKQLKNEPLEEAAKGPLQITMRLSKDASYSVFYQADDNKMPTHLKEPVYFEVELEQSNDLKVVLELDQCWATLYQDRGSTPRWNLIVNGCANPVDPYQVVFHPVTADSRIQYPSHVKRFEVRISLFPQQQVDQSGKVYVHCDVIICDENRPEHGSCARQCPNDDSNRGHKRAVSSVLSIEHVSSGPILMSSK